MTQATRIDNDEALRLVGLHELTANHVLVVGSQRIRATQQNGCSSFRFWFGENLTNWVSEDVLTVTLHLTDVYVELETPSPFDAPEFEGWKLYPQQNRMYISGRRADISMDEYGAIFARGQDFHAVPIDRIPEAARHINALLALGEK